MYEYKSAFFYRRFNIINTINAQTLVGGKIDRIENFQSKYITARDIDIWLPEGYTDSKKYAVLYMHDGQMLYDPSQSGNKQAWNIDDIASDLMSNNKVKNFIVVGIWNGGPTRHQEYFPQKPFEQLKQIEKDTLIAQLQRAERTKEIFQLQSDKYLEFVVKELNHILTINIQYIQTGKTPVLLVAAWAALFHFMLYVNILKYLAVQHVCRLIGLEHLSSKIIRYPMHFLPI